VKKHPEKMSGTIFKMKLNLKESSGLPYGTVFHPKRGSLYANLFVSNLLCSQKIPVGLFLNFSTFFSVLFDKLAFQISVLWLCLQMLLLIMSAVGGCHG
jgi:hypothetical protein